MLSEKDFNRHPCFNVKAKGQYGRVDDAVKIIDPRKE